MRGTKPLAPMSNWHRLLTMLSLNGGSLYRAQLYTAKPKIKKYVDHDGNTKYKSIPAKDLHTYIDTGKLRKVTCVSSFAPLSYAYEHRAESMGLVHIKKFNNRKWITLLPKGRAVLAMLDVGKKWVPETKIEREFIR